MLPVELNGLWVIPTLDWMAYRLGKPQIATAEAQVYLTAIAGLESAWKYRKQLGGPARGWWQFETGGVHEVRDHPTTGKWVRLLEDGLGLPTDQEVSAIKESFAYDLTRATVYARLLLYCDPSPLTLDAKLAWKVYLRRWRPGKPRQEKWGFFWDQAMAAVGAEEPISQGPPTPGDC